MKHKPLTIVFDLDGTLIDSLPDLGRILNGILADDGRRALGVGEVRLMMGGGVERLISRGFDATGSALAQNEITSLTKEFLRRYRANSVQDTTLFPGVRDGLSALKQHGLGLAVCTNKARDLAETILARFDIDNAFNAIIGGDGPDGRKPSPAIVQRTLKAAGGTANHAIMVGDTSNDIEAARAAGVRSVAVAFGYAHGPVTALGADHVIASFDGLLPLIENLHLNHQPEHLSV